MKTIKTVVRAGAIEAGHAIQLDLAYADGTQESLRCEAHIVPGLLQAVTQAGAGSEQLRRGAPAQAIDVAAPYLATNCGTGTGQDGSVVLRFATRGMVPVQVAMTPELARETIARLTAELGLQRSKPAFPPKN